MARRKKRLRQIPGAILPTNERLRIAAGYDELTEASAGGVLKKTGAIRVWTQLENLHRNRRLTDIQYDAGIKFHADWYLGLQAGQSVTMRWSEYISGIGGGEGNMDAAERRVFHSRRYAEASRILDELGVRRALQLFVIQDIPAEHIGRKINGYRGQRAATASGVTIIGIGLQRLARFYGLAK